MADKRFKTKYKGVIYREIASRVRPGQNERVWYICTSIKGKQVEERVGREWEDRITLNDAVKYLTGRRDGSILSPRERKAKAKAQREAHDSRWTIDRLWRRYTETRTIKGIVTDKNRYENHLKPVFGDKEPHEILALDVDRVRINLQRKRSAGTVHNVLELFRRLVNFGVKQNLTQPLQFHLTMPKVNNIQTDNLTHDQITALLKTIEASVDHAAGAMMKLALFTGMRRGEMFRLQWSHIDFENEFITLVDPKGGVDQKIPLNESAKDVLESIEQEGQYVFSGKDGGQRVETPRGVEKIAKDAGLPKGFRPLHGLRHVFASALASSGQIDMYTLQKLLTHKSPQMTQRYAHLHDDRLKQASLLVDDMFAPKSKRKRKRISSR